MGFLKSKLFRFIASLALAALFYFLCPPCFSKVYLGCVLALLLIIINFNTFFARFRWLTHIARFLVGGLFIFSGFIKANDPIGFSIKLGEYFEVFGQGFSCDMQIEKSAAKGIPCSCQISNKNQEILDEKIEKSRAHLDSMIVAGKAATDYYVDENGNIAMKKVSSLKPFYDFMGKHSLGLAIFICGFEIVLGVFLLMGLQVRWTLGLLLAMIVFFSFLTFYSACCNKVTSCGCFGDFIKLVPWESFWKDLILLILISILMVGKNNIQPIFKNRILLAGIAGILIFASFAFPVYTYRHLPIFDFRPYKIGTNLWDASHTKDPAKTGCKNDSINMRFFYRLKKDTSVVKEFNIHNLPDSTWDFCCRYDEVIRKGNCGATIMDFNLTDPESGESLNDSLFHLKGIQFMLVMEDIDLADRGPSKKINEFYKSCVANKIPFNALSGATEEQVAAFRKETAAAYPILQVDGTALKTVIRSNPGLVLVKDGVVAGMWSANDFPDYKTVVDKYGK